MTIKTRASLQSFFQRGDRPTSAQFSDFINSCIMLRANGSAVQTGIYEVESTASTTAIPVGTFARTFIGVNTTAQAQAFMAFTSASGAGGGAFGQDWLNANTTADAAPLLGGFIASNVLVSAGDTLYTDGSGLQRLPIGSAGQLLAVNSSADTPEWIDPTPSLATTQLSTSGTSIDFTGIPAGTKRIVVELVTVSTNGTNALVLQIGDSGGVEGTGYSCQVANLASNGVAGPSSVTNGFNTAASLAGASWTGTLTLTLQDVSNNRWVGTLNIMRSDGAISLCTGFKALSAELDRIRITTTTGTDTFDSGSINILYE